MCIFGTTLHLNAYLLFCFQFIIDGITSRQHFWTLLTCGRGPFPTSPLLTHTRRNPPSDYTPWRDPLLHSPAVYTPWWDPLLHSPVHSYRLPKLGSVHRYYPHWVQLITKVFMNNILPLAWWYCILQVSTTNCLQHTAQISFFVKDSHTKVDTPVETQTTLHDSTKAAQCRWHATYKKSTQTPRTWWLLTAINLLLMSSKSLS